ncbi:helix-turn-helix transcriptional regulator [Methylobacterium fujisawaense]|uniref:helix-turn-helix transcriptional regulator n=1 Tax=Methylobacterium fujisawaense TaxID=107400 RepID=UPI002F35E581
MTLPLETTRRRVLKTKDAAAFVGMTAATLLRMRDREEVPKPINLSARLLGWRIGDLSDYLDCREAGREWKDCQGTLNARGAA